MAYHNWLIEVIDDLIEYTKENDLPETLWDLTITHRTVEREIQAAAGAHIATTSTTAEIHPKQ